MLPGLISALDRVDVFIARGVLETNLVLYYSKGWEYRGSSTYHIIHLFTKILGSPLGKVSVQASLLIRRRASSSRNTPVSLDSRVEEQSAGTLTYNTNLTGVKRANT